MRTSIADQLADMHQKYQTLTSEDGGRLVILERGSRVMELTVPHRTENALWSNLSAIDKEDWNIGGDRTWISPEMEFFINGNKHYAVPPQLDPGSYKLEVDPYRNSVRSEQKCRLTHNTDQLHVDIQIEKQYTLIPNPFRMNHLSSNYNINNVRYVGYQCVSQLTVRPHQRDPLASSPDFPSSEISSSLCNLWSIMQVPMGGTALIPTRSNAEPFVMFKGEDDLNMDIQPHVVGVPFKGDNKFKISFNALQSTGRFGYLLRLNEYESSLVVRQFQVNPSAIYPDYPQSQKEFRGSCMQFFFDGGQLGNFGELEYHTPAVDIHVASSYSDASQVYYFVGKSEEIAQIVKHLL